MASAGTVTVDFAAEVAKFNAQLKTVQTSMGKLDAGFAKAGRALKGFIGVGAIVAGVSAFVRATAESEAAVAQLDSALKNAGNSVNLSSKAFQDFAAEMQRVTTFTDEAVIGVESILLSFKGLSGGTVIAATKAVLDLSTRLKIDLNSAAKLVGKALQDPEKGLTALSRAGVVFSEQQKEVIKSLIDTGKTAEAQQFILKQLGDRFGGAATAARDTFGGALTAVKNAFGDLLEGRTGVPGLTNSLNELADSLNDPATKRGFNDLLSFLASVITLAVQAAAGLGQFVGALDRIPKPGAISGTTEELEKLALAGNKVAASQLAIARSAPVPLAGPRGFGRPQAAEDLPPELDEEFVSQQQDRVLAALTRISQLKNKLALDEFERLTKEFEETEKIREEHQQRILDNETKLSEQRRQLALDEFNVLGRQLEERVRAEEDVQERIRAIKLGAVNDAIGFLQLLGARSKTAAKIAFVLEKAKAIASAIVSTQAAAAKALEVYGPTPAGFAAAGAAIAFGAARVAIIASTALEGANQISSGARLGTPANPVFTQTPTGQQADFGASSQSAVSVIIANNVGFDQHTMDQIIDGIREAVDGRDVVIFGPNSLQAQQLAG